jgi:putative nucleotidyltransferase with HDIG domain
VKTKNESKYYFARSVAILALTVVCFAGLIFAKNADRLGLTNILVEIASLILLIASIALYLFFADKELLTKPRLIMTVAATMLVSFCFLWVAESVVGEISLAPFGLCALMVALLVKARIGFFSNFIVVMIYFLQSVLYDGSEMLYEQTFFLLFAGVISAIYVSYVLGRQYRRLSYVYVGLIIGALAAACRVMTYFMFYSDYNAAEFFRAVALAFGSGIMTVMLMFVLLPIWERVFNVVSVFRFAEIATSNTKVMRMLFEKAPGTYNHSLTVANYVEACATAIGENTFLARAVSYYHDIGKMKNPSYFSENQIDGDNPHDSLTPEASVNVLKAHATNGLLLAVENHLPVEVQRAIVEHHGTMPMKYFYLKAKKYTDGDLPYTDYRYDGPKPTSKITAILMICDASEAALRSLGSTDLAEVEALVDMIVEERVSFDQFSDCDITFRDLDVIKSTIITTYLGIKHQRVRYPKGQLG